MTPRITAFLAAAILTSACTANSSSQTSAVPATQAREFVSGPCKAGIFQSETGAFVVLTNSQSGFEYSFDDGIVGSIGQPGSRVECGEGGARIDGTELWSAVNFGETDTRFQSRDVELAGRLMEPPGADKNTPLVVYAHGSEGNGWIGRTRDPYQMVARGVSVFVYDKRGTGQSQGVYVQNFPKLADDLVAASHEAKRLADGRFGRFGLLGLSQGGWIAPLAAERAGAEFIGIGYGLVSDIREEDAAQVQLELREAGYGPDVLEEARQITDVTARIAASNYTDGLEELTELQERYSQEQWYQSIQGGYTGVFLGMSAEELRENGVAQFNNLEIDWTLNPMDVVRQVNVPQLWILAEEDREAPIELTLERLETLRQEGKDISLYVFPSTDHGMWEFEKMDDGSRKLVRVTPGYYDLIADWAKGDVTREYGSSYIVPR